jgi:diguanylate cyclase (GGDEF)-like protein
MAAILFADLDRFKQVNDQHGHNIGDELLVAVAQRLTAVLRPGDTLARLSGDEFVILCEDLDGPREVEALAARIEATLATRFLVGGIEVDATASVGIAFSGRGDQLSEQILRNADTAMYQAKRKGGARHQIVDLREKRVTADRAAFEQDLRGAAGRGELRTDYQPIVETGDGRIVGVEALLRWAHPSRGLVAPTVVIPLAESCGMIGDIGLWVLGQACAYRHRAQTCRPGDELTMSVNVSAHQLMSRAFASSVSVVLAGTDTDPGLVTLEVTESVFVQDRARALVVLGELKRVGVKIALDDFGTGYSSLNYLKRFPIDTVKIDQEFIADLEIDEASRAIVSAVVELSHRLGMTVVAEGVETAEQHEQLVALGCDYCQGYYFALPMSAADLDTLLAQHLADGTAQMPARAPVVST